MSLKGSPELKARLKAIGKNVFKPAGKDWADEAVRLGKQRVPNRNTKYSTGRLHDSIRRKSATQKKAIVIAHYSAYFVDHGVKPHSLQRRKSRPTGRIGRTVFESLARKSHPGYRARPFRASIARDALKKYPVSQKVIAAWNEAA